MNWVDPIPSFVVMGARVMLYEAMLEEQKPISIDAYLSRVNAGLRKVPVRVIGEISEANDYGGSRSYLFFKIKGEDEEGGTSILNCMMWQRNYAISGVKLEVGTEVIVSGFAQVYKPSGRFTFQVETVELAGEGLLKKAYDELRAKLEKEGLFASERKRPLPRLPHKVGLITSKDGAAIGDFRENLGRFGFKIKLVDSRVEGQQAIHDLLAAMRAFRKQDIEVLVIVRGGGSLEALLPFNNETLVREVADFPVPVLAGIGHEKDVSLVGLTADAMVSTPSIAAEALNSSWERAGEFVTTSSLNMFNMFERALGGKRTFVERSFVTMKDHLQAILDDFDDAAQSVRRVMVSLRARMFETRRNIDVYPGAIEKGMSGLIRSVRMRLDGALEYPVDQLERAVRAVRVGLNLDSELRLLGRAMAGISQTLNASERLLHTNSPERQLRLGYSIVKGPEGIVKNVGQLMVGQSVDILLQDGSFEGRVERITENK
ncbi:MAG TPA: exodeoxyribonuclease VII large subunit [Candidatus Paceibacterota bacterium]